MSNLNLDVIKKMLSQNQINNAIRELEKIAPNRKISNRIRIIQSRYYRIEEDSRLGLISRTDEDIAKNKINLSLINILDELDETKVTGGNQFNLDRVNSNPISSYLNVLGIVVVIALFFFIIRMINEPYIQEQNREQVRNQKVLQEMISFLVKQRQLDREIQSSFELMIEQTEIDIQEIEKINLLYKDLSNEYFIAMEENGFDHANDIGNKINQLLQKVNEIDTKDYPEEIKIELEKVKIKLEKFNP